MAPGQPGEGSDEGAGSPENPHTVPFHFSFPTELYFVPSEVQRVGGCGGPTRHKALLVTGWRAMRASGILERVLDDHLRSAGVEAAVFD
ncbi:MAG: hypothetical protein IMW99_09900 [Firmicutes bacterium]|nr:hypothetical protein [Bacillota bacterium]